LEIIYATYGDAGDETNAVDVTVKCIQKLNESNNKDRIGFRPPMRLDEFFLGYTVPYSSKDKIQKQLRMLYRIDKVFATLVFYADYGTFFLNVHFILLSITDFKLFASAHGVEAFLAHNSVGFNQSNVIQASLSPPFQRHLWTSKSIIAFPKKLC